MNRLFFLGAGTGIWFLATVVFRVAGQVFFRYDNNLVMLGLYVLAAIALIIISLYLFDLQKLERAARFEAAALLVLPGMILDAGVAHFFGSIMPNMDLAAGRIFAGWLLFAYAMPLIAAFIPIRGADAQTR